MTEAAFVREDVIKTLLDNEKVNVFFFKVNGDEREMNCTLNADVLKREGVVVSTPDETTVIDPNQVRVFDIDIKQWRSFLLTNLVEITVK